LPSTQLVVIRVNDAFSSSSTNFPTNLRTEITGLAIRGRVPTSGNELDTLTAADDWITNMRFDSFNLADASDSDQTGLSDISIGEAQAAGVGGVSGIWQSVYYYVDISSISADARTISLTDSTVFEFVMTGGRNCFVSSIEFWADVKGHQAT